jgi:hypothetical protein
MHSLYQCWGVETPPEIPLFPGARGITFGRPTPLRGQDHSHHHRYDASRKKLHHRLKDIIKQGEHFLVRLSLLGAVYVEALASS